MDLVKLISEQVQPYTKPAVYISGGLDSTIILHHLREKLSKTKIYTYTAKFGTYTDEHEQAQKVADHYKTQHLTVEINGNDLLDQMSEIQRIFDRPRFNVWPWFLAQAAKYDKRKTIYIGEGSDEIFGGYSDRSYLEGWAGQLIYVYPTYARIHKHFNLDLETPFLSLNFMSMLNLYEPPYKQILRTAYKNILPDFVMHTPSQPPAFCQYLEYVEPYYPRGVSAKTNLEAKQKLQKLVTKIWLEVNR